MPAPDLRIRLCPHHDSVVAIIGAARRRLHSGACHNARHEDLGYAEDEIGVSKHVVVLDGRFWQRHFQGDRAVIGRTLQINGDNYTIVGVMPRSLAFNDTIDVSDVYLPFSLQHDSIEHPIRAIPWIKLKANVSLAAADPELDAIVSRVPKLGFKIAFTAS